MAPKPSSKLLSTPEPPPPTSPSTSPSRATLISATLAKFKVALHASYDEAEGPVLSLSQRQHQSRLDKGPSKRLWSVPVEFPQPPEDDALRAVRDTVEALRQTPCRQEDSTVHELQGSSVRAEWIANRRDGTEVSEGSNAVKFERLCRDVDGDMVIVYVHGGAYFLNGPGTSRAPAARLSTASNSRVLALDYRLAPQSAFPSPILDLLVTYLTLLYPPPGSLHNPVPASRIVFAGESCGANICLGVVQVFRHLGARYNTQPPTPSRPLTFHHIPRHIPMPAGLALLGTAADYTYAPLPSWTINAPHDIWRGYAPFAQPEFPTDKTWPTIPPRADPYCSRSDLVHPLVSPCLARSWSGSCPMWLAEGQEQMLDGAKVVAKTALTDGVVVLWEEYACMPHSWPLLLPMFPQSGLAWERWGRAARAFVDGTESGRSGGLKVEVEDLKLTRIDLGQLTSLMHDQVRVLIWEKAKERKDYVGREQGRGKAKM